MTNLIWQLQVAHAIETGAYEAYEGHANSLKNPCEREKIKQIQKDEWFHRQTVGFMLIELKAGPNHVLDGLLWLIGRTISLSCYVIGYRAAMWGAKIMEVFGSNIYGNLAAQCVLEGQGQFMLEFCKMAHQEREHEEFFKNILNPPCICRYLAYLSGCVAREVNESCKADHRR